jgi:hypothetical protein
MILDSDPLFENCIIKTSTKFKPKLEVTPPLEETSSADLNIIDNLQIDTLQIDTLQIDNSLPLKDPVTALESTDTKDEDDLLDNLQLDIEELPDTNDYDVNLKELDNIAVSITTDEPLKLKKPNNVYLDLYREARNKAKVAKKNAILAYLEAKNIKKTFMLDNLDDFDSDFDDEIDEVSESELDNL